MREVNFSIPNVNKASVGITTALYDRRALDCTSTLPLVNSLNSLAYLTTSSGRIRDILTVDGGIERLVCMLKEGRNKDQLEMFKWNLAFICVVNIGIRGSEAVRTRVVEADMVPVIATILDNYFRVIERSKEKHESERRKSPHSNSKSASRSSHRAESQEHRSIRTRRHAPPPISIPDVTERPSGNERLRDLTPPGSVANLSLSSPPERTTFSRAEQRPFWTAEHVASSSQNLTTPPVNPPHTAVPSQSSGASAGSSSSVRPVRDADRLPSMVPKLHAENSQPQSPTTPSGPSQRTSGNLAAVGASRQRRRPSLRQQASTSGSDNDGPLEEIAPEVANLADDSMEPTLGLQTDIVMQDMAADESILQPTDDAVTINIPDASNTDDETFNIAHPSAGDGSISPTANPTQTRLGFARARLPNVPDIAPANTPQPPFIRYPLRVLQTDQLLSTNARTIPAALPRDEDVIMALQLLAYVSKYCNLRKYFQESRLVPRLKIRESDLSELIGETNGPAPPTQEELDDEWDNEFVEESKEEPYNIFPLIEKFTAKHASTRYSSSATPQHSDMHYWAGVVMRNLCRKDDNKGGIRQCAYWKCGKWEEWPRQFAKCRRCRRTKYCSKDCQKGAWASHRFWC
ncbi:uncharacterized protein K489DRAFT_295895, partial [Dissoconium aciculare CBS 342.82]|uniref:MYND-type zinc finger protein samB n=1 Tax=Dissoconium aciculare CBS 342.82 TaxID=1314786 RepID=A0A6J3LW39_9PEZI